MRAVLFALLGLAALGVAGVSSAQTRPAVDPSLERCVRDNVANVERGIADLDTATTFLVQKVCAVESAAEFAQTQRQQYEAMRAQYQQTCQQHRAAAAQRSTTTQQASEDADLDPCTMADGLSAMTGSSWVSVVGANYSSPAATALAARLLLERRLARAPN